MSDVVWNHTAHNSEWLNEHPDAAYSPANSPHLQPADELERALLDINGRLQEFGVPDELISDSDVAKIISAVKQHALGPLKLWQYYVVDVKAATESFRAAVSSSGKSESQAGAKASAASLKDVAAKIRASAVQNEMTLAGRFATTIDAKSAAQIIQSEYGVSDRRAVCRPFRQGRGRSQCILLRAVRR